MMVINPKDNNFYSLLFSNISLRTIFLCFLYCITSLFSFNLDAQSNETEQQISELFKNPKKIQWYKNFKGRVDDINDVGLTIAYDGRDCKGYITYLRSKERFKLEGKIIGKKIKLRETDTEESVTGHFEGQIFGDYDRMKAHWFNKEKTRAGLLMLEQVEKEVIFPTYCGDNKWVRKYQGNIQGKPVEFTIQKNSDLDIKGIIWFKDSNLTHYLKGGMIADNALKIIVIDDMGNKLGGIEGEILKPSFKINGNWITPEGDTHLVKFNKIDHMMVGCIEYQDYMSTYDVTFPKSKNSSFNSFIEKTVSDWKISCKEKVKALKVENQYPGPEDRSIANATGWFELEHVSDTLISGFMIFNKSWEEEHQDYSFNYSLLNDEKIELEQLFREGVDYHSILQERVIKSIQFKPIYSNEGFKEWINTVSFNYFTIRQNGIRYSTSFHPIYGRQSITIHFDDIKEYLNPYSPVSYLYYDVRPIKKSKKKKKK